MLQRIRPLGNIDCSSRTNHAERRNRFYSSVGIVVKRDSHHFLLHNGGIENSGFN